MLLYFGLIMGTFFSNLLGILHIKHHHLLELTPSDPPKKVKEIKVDIWNEPNFCALLG